MSRQAIAWCGVLGGLAFIVAFAVFMNQRQEPGGSNGGLPLFLVGVGAFLVLIAVISSNGRRPPD